MKHQRLDPSAAPAPSTAPDRSPAAPSIPPGFTPVAVRPRADGWTRTRQAEFIAALGECACVEDACARVGMSPSSAYALRRRIDAQSFRLAWDIALDYAIRRLSDAAYSRAIHGVARPVFFQGEQVGERRYYDERLTMFLLRYRDPVRYGAWLDLYEAKRDPDGAASTLADALDDILDGVPARAADAPSAVTDTAADPSASRSFGNEDEGDVV